MDLRKIKKLIDLLEESNLAELEIKEGEEIVRLSRLPKGMVSAQMMAPAPLVSTVWARSGRAMNRLAANRAECRMRCVSSEC